MAKKGFKNIPGIPEIYDEVKIRKTMTLTPTAIKGLDELAKQKDLSRSELVERIGRGIITLNG
jgi:hypothetical protein